MFKKKGQETIDNIIGNNLDYLVRFAFFRLGNHAQAEDIVFDAVLRFLEKVPPRIDSGAVRAYLFRIVYRLCIDLSRTRKPNFVDIDLIDVEDEGENGLDLEETIRINKCLEVLPKREAEVIMMNVIDGLSFVEISSILSIPQSTAKSRYKSGMDKLRKQYINSKNS